MKLKGYTATFAQSRITQEHKDRAADIVSQMTLDEKKSYTADGTIDIHLAPGGGWAAIISKAGVRE